MCLTGRVDGVTLASQSEKPVFIFDRGRDSLHELILNGDTPGDLPELRAACFGGFEIPEHTHDSIV